MSKMSEQEKAFWYQRFTVEGRIFYPDLLEPKAKEGQREKYGCLFAWKMGSNPAVTQAIGQFLAQAKQNYFPTVPQQYFVNPCKRFDTYQRMDGKPNAEFLRDCYWMNLSSGKDFPPQVVDKMRQKIIDKAEVYSGRNAVVSISFYKIDNDKKGVGVNINAVMLMDGGNKEGGAAAPDVNELFGQFAADMGVSHAPAQPAPAPAQEQPAWPPQGNTNNGMGGFI